MSRSPGLLYRLTYALSLTQIATGLATIFVYEIEDARDSQFIAILYAINTFYMVYMLIPHTTQRETDPVSRLNKQFVIINFLLLCWVLSVGMAPLTVGAGITRTIDGCFDEGLFTPKCLVVGLDMALPFALIATLGTISSTIYRGARALQAIQAAPLEPQLPRRPFKLRPARTLSAQNAQNQNGTTSAGPPSSQPTADLLV